jgi:hypothetical protein
VARLVLNNAYVVLGASSDISDHVASITLSSSYDVVETTSFGDSAKKRVAGLVDNSITLELHQDYAASSIESIIYPLLGTAVAFECRPVNTTVGAANPKYTGSALVTEWTPLNGSVGELATASVTWPISGAITKSVTP